MDSLKEELLEEYKEKINILNQKIALLEKDIANLEEVLNDVNFAQGFSTLDEQLEARKNIEKQVELYKKSLDKYGQELYMSELSVYQLDKELHSKNGSETKANNKKRNIKNKVKVTALTVAMASLIPLSISVQNALSTINNLATAPIYSDSLKDQKNVINTIKENESLAKDINRYAVLKSVGSLSEEEKEEKDRLEKSLFDQRDSILEFSNDILKAKLAETYNIDNTDKISIEAGRTIHSSGPEDYVNVNIAGEYVIVKSRKLEAVAIKIYDAGIEPKDYSNRRILKRVLSAYNKAMTFARENDLTIKSKKLFGYTSEQKVIDDEENEIEETDKSTDDSKYR